MIGHYPYIAYRFLREGWLGPTLDGADDQWRELRENLPLICGAIIAHGLLSLIVRKLSPDAEEASSSKAAIESPRDSIAEKDAILDNTDASPGRASAKNSLAAIAFLPTGELGRRRVLLNAGVSAIFVGLMHGTHALFPIALVCGTFALGHALKGTRFAQPVVWMLAVFLIWLKERWYSLFTFEAIFGAGLAWLDGYRGMHHWRLSFNLVVLKIVSFNVDLHWAEQQQQQAKRSSAVSSSVGYDQLVPAYSICEFFGLVHYYVHPTRSKKGCMLPNWRGCTLAGERKLAHWRLKYGITRDGLC